MATAYVIDPSTDGSGIILDTTGAVGARFDARGRRVKNSGVTAPTIAAGAAAGTSPTVAVAGTDEVGTATVTVGTSPAAGILATITFAAPYAVAPAAALLTPQTALGATAQLWATTTTTTLVIHVGAAPTASTAYPISYQVVGG